MKLLALFVLLTGRHDTNAPHFSTLKYISLKYILQTVSCTCKARESTKQSHSDIYYNLVVQLIQKTLNITA